MNHQVFICYAHADKGRADAICLKLESSDVRCWIAPRDISPSKDWAEETIDAINSAAIMILIFSSNSNESPQVRREIERAVHKGVNILPFRIEDVPLSKSLEYFISTPHWLDAIAPPYEAHLDKLRDCVKGLLDGLPVDCRPTTMPSATASSVRSSAPAASAVSARLVTAFEPRDLKYIETQLAGYVGPMAKLLVKRAAEKTSSIQELVGLLANELSAESEKKFFSENCRFLDK
jgi:hypothetical protein